MLREDAPPPPIPGCPGPDCEGPLELWQPFEGDPDYLVGHCRECGAILTLEPEGDGWRAVVVAYRPSPAGPRASARAG